MVYGWFAVCSLRFLFPFLFPLLRRVLSAEGGGLALANLHLLRQTATQRYPFLFSFPFPFLFPFPLPLPLPLSFPLPLSIGILPKYWETELVSLLPALNLKISEMQSGSGFQPICITLFFFWHASWLYWYTKRKKR